MGYITSDILSSISLHPSPRLQVFPTDAKAPVPRFATTLGDRQSEVQDIEIKTVDGFQGREKEVIIFSTVRYQIHGPMNFIVDERRLNVGSTRAKRG